MPNTVIIGSGSCIPERIIDGSFFLDSKFYTDDGTLIDKPNEEIIKKFTDITEIESRHYTHDYQSNSDLGVIAAQQAIAEANIDKEEIDYIIYASNFGDVTKDGFVDFMPSMSAKVKNKLGIKNRNCVNYDMIFGCPGWVEAMILANVLIQSKRAKTILVIGGETLSRVTDPFDRNKMIFADGAGAVVVQATDENIGILSDKTICDNQEELHYLSNNKSVNPEHKTDKLFISMKGRKIYEYALSNVPSAIKETVDSAGISIDDVDKILIHQANAKMDHAIIGRLFKLYGKSTYDPSIAPMTIQTLGNSSVATVPTMYDLISKGKMEGHSFKKGGYVVFTSVGAGMNINCFIYRMPS